MTGRHRITSARSKAALLAAGALAGSLIAVTLTASGQTGATVQGDQTCSFSIANGVVSPLNCVTPSAPPTSPSPTASPTTSSPTADPTTPSSSATTPAPTMTETPTELPTGPASGFPDATNTGVPAGTDLTNSGPITTSHDGQVIQNLKITGTVLVKNAGVVIRNCEIVGSGNSFGVELFTGASGTVIQDSTIHGVNQGKSRLMYGIFDYNGANAAGLTVQRVNAYWISHDVQVEQGVIADSYFHDMGFVPGDHTEPIGSWGGSKGQLTIHHNTILNDQDQTAAIYLTAQYGNEVNRTVTDNLLAGGGYTIYGGARSGGYSTANIVITGNQFSNRYFPKAGSYGPAAYYTASDPGNVWSGNTWADGASAGKAVASP